MTSLLLRNVRPMAGAPCDILVRNGKIAGLGRFEPEPGMAVEDGGGVWPEGESPKDPAWLRMSVRSTGHLGEDEFVAMVRDEIPAHVRAELWVDARRVLCSTEEEW